MPTGNYESLIDNGAFWDGLPIVVGLHPERELDHLLVYYSLFSA